jgi:hypothetical protein
MALKVPEGYYCYAIESVDPKTGRMKIKPCPFWGRDASRPEQENGYCTKYGYKDWEATGLGLLWDMVKECRENLDG